MVLRGLQIVLVSLGFALDAVVAWLFMRLGASARMVKLPVKARLKLERLGPTFVKLGQALSERRDLLDAKWAASLSLLQSQAAPFSGTVAEKLVEAALGDTPDILFRTFSREPLAAGSVAQVHAAQLHDGRAVVVKILRPKVRAQLARDMRILRLLVRLFSPLIPALRRYNAAGIIHELSRNLLRETDLVKEARNVRIFARAFEAWGMIYIPGVVDELSAGSVMTQERSRGHSLDAVEPAAGLDAVAETFIDFYLHQFFVLGVFHADPHPGNLLVMPDGGLCIHDFGAVGQLDTRSREALLAFVVAFIHLDPDWLTEAAIELGLVSASADRQALGRGVEEILNDLKGAELADWSLARTMIDIGRLSAERTLFLPPHLASLVRTAFTAEGALRQMNPEADMLRLLQEAGGRLFADGKTPAKGSGSPVRFEWELARFSRRAPELAAAWIRKISEGRLASSFSPSPAQIAAENPLAKGLSQIALSVVSLGAYIAAAILMLGDQADPFLGNMPLLSAIGFAIALWLTALVLIRSRRRRRGDP